MSTEKKSEPGWKQHYPTYHFSDKDMALEEYKSAAKALEAEERVFINAANFAVIAGSVLGSLTVGNLQKIIKNTASIIPAYATLIFILLFAGFFSVLTLRYFADRQKAVVFAARKVIVLRRMLGMSYGNFQLILPNWRIEGADEAFAIRLFPGWNTYVVYPFYAIFGISVAVIFFVLPFLFEQLKGLGYIFLIDPFLLIICSILLWLSVLMIVYRKSLLDTHERLILVFLKGLSFVLKLSIIRNFENIIYRAKLSKFEVHRLNIDLINLKKVLVFVEDKTFYKHCGISVNGLLRLFWSILGRSRKAGGSTITQQLVRTLFIIDQKKLFRRKIIEIFMALWFDKVIQKNEQLEIYLAAVRFETNVFGVVDASKYFFGELKHEFTLAESFF